VVLDVGETDSDGEKEMVFDRDNEVVAVMVWEMDRLNDADPDLESVSVAVVDSVKELVQLAEKELVDVDERDAEHEADTVVLAVPVGDTVSDVVVDAVTDFVAVRDVVCDVDAVRVAEMLKVDVEEKEDEVVIVGVPVNVSEFVRDIDCVVDMLID
jgi:succinyl-CoA synthetase alpha subunit